MKYKNYIFHFADGHSTVVTDTDCKRAKQLATLRAVTYHWNYNIVKTEIEAIK
jgi:hypothetical protein